MTDLKSYPLADLEALYERILTEITKREKDEAERLQKEAAAAAAEAERQAREAAEAEAAARAAAKAAEDAAKAAAAQAEAGKIRYMHPSNRALTWSGVGPTPDWIHAWLTTGGTLYALEVAAEKLAPKTIPASFLKP